MSFVVAHQIKLFEEMKQSIVLQQNIHQQLVKGLNDAAAAANANADVNAIGMPLNNGHFTTGSSRMQLVIMI